MSKPVTVLLQKRMSRKEFLTTLGFGMASVMGFSSVIHFLTGKSVGDRLNSRSSARGYGASPYGG